MGDAELTERFNNALREPNLIIELDRNLFGGQALIHLKKPGSTPRSKPVQLVPVLVGDPGQSHADMLEQISRAMRVVQS